MSVTYREPGLVGLAHTPEADPVLGEAAHYNGENPPSSGRPLAPLRELIDDRLWDALLERSRGQGRGRRAAADR
jgi:hypothetical protein